MKKIPTLFERGEDFRVTNVVKPECQWVLDGEGVATIKWDGTSCMIREGKLYKRREFFVDTLSYEKAVETLEFELDDPEDLNRGLLKLSGWVPVDDSPADKFHREAFEIWKKTNEQWKDVKTTCELLGPSINRNSHGLKTHELWRHGDVSLDGCPRDFDALKAYLKIFVDDPSYSYCEGVVWHHPDGRMAKLKVSDFFGKKAQEYKIKKA